MTKAQSIIFGICIIAIAVMACLDKISENTVITIVLTVLGYVAGYINPNGGNKNE